MLFEEMADNHSVKFNNPQINAKTDTVLEELKQVFEEEENV